MRTYIAIAAIAALPPPGFRCQRTERTISSFSSAGGADASPPDGAGRAGARPRPGLAPGAGVVAVQAGDAEGQVQGLAAVEPRVTRRLVAAGQVGLGDVVAAAYAFGDVIAGELNVDAAGVGAERPVHLEEARHLVQHVVEVPGLAAAGHLDGVAVHRVADPHDGGSAGRHLLHQGRQRLANPARAHPGNQGEAAGLAVRVEHAYQGQDILRAGRRADLDGDGIADLTSELDVGAVEGTGPLPYPQQVSGQVVGLPAPRVRPG